MKTVMLTRNNFADLLKEMKLVGRAAEIGVAEGYFSHYLLDRWPGWCYQIDPWRRLDVQGYSLHGEEDQDARYLRITDASKKYNGRCLPIRATSDEAVAKFSDSFLDFCYIDAIHTYAAAQEDIDLWWPKVKAGGILAGHDYLEGVFHGQDYGVKSAVNEFAAENKLTVHVTQETDWPSWYIFKS